MKYILSVLLAIVTMFIGGFSVHAANIRVVTNLSQVAEGQSVKATVYIDSPTENINNSEGILSFSSDLLTVSSINSSGSMFTMWVGSPTSDGQGHISFNGGIPNPGFTGNSGKVFEVNFVAKATGSANLSFSNTAIRLNDGQGTNVIGSASPATISIVPKSIDVPVLVPPPVVTQSVPQAPLISSLVMPDEEKWYNLSGAQFKWNVPSGVTASQLLLGSRLDSIPTILYRPAISSKTLDELPEGEWYLHLRLQNASGWGKITHRKILVDRTSPTDVAASYKITANGVIELSLSGTDTLSGIEKFVIDVGEGSLVEVSTSNGKKETMATLPIISPGEHEIIITAHDYAGNTASATLSLVAPKLLAPRIIDYPEKVKKGDRFEISGDARYPQTEMKIFVQEEGESTREYVLQSKIDGTFLFSSDAVLKSGVVTVWAENVLNSSVSSEPSEKVRIIAENTHFFKIGSRIIDLLSVFVPLAALLMLLAYLLHVGFYRIVLMRRRVKKDLIETGSNAHKIFEVLKDDVKKYLELKDKPVAQGRLTLEEKLLLKDLAKDIEDSENYFEKKFESIRKNDLK